jgi:hypothetical protein
MATLDLTGPSEKFQAVLDQINMVARVDSAILVQSSILDRYRILRAHHQWTMFQAIRDALWLAR